MGSRIALCMAFLLAASPLLAQGPGRRQAPPRRGAAMPPEMQLLRRIGDAQRTLKYTGRRVTLVRVGATEVRNVENVWSDQMRERIEFERGSANAGQVIVTNGRTRQHYFPATNEIHVTPSRLENPIRRIVQLVAEPGGPRFRTAKSAGESIAGRETSVITVTDPSGTTIAKVWYDNSTLLILKRELFNPTGRLVGSYEFTRVAFNPKLDPTDFVLNRPGAKVIDIRELMMRTCREVGVPPRILAPGSGFQLDSVRKLDLGGKFAVVQGYTGEEGRLSLFILRGTVDDAKVKRLAAGQMASRVIQRGEETILLVGDMSADRLNRLVSFVQ